MNIPFVILFCYLLLGMITTAALWPQMAMEIEMSLHMEEDTEMHGAMRFFLMLMFVVTWPIVLYEVVSKR